MKAIIKRTYVIIRWRWLWKAQMKFKRMKSIQHRKLLWRVYRSQADYSVYKAGKGSGLGRAVYVA